MDLSALLGGLARGGAQPQAPANGVLASLKAGKFHSDGENGNAYRLRSDARKGELRITRDGQSVVHLQWRDRSTGTVEDDMTVFPQDVTIKRIVSPNDKDRAYEVAFTQGGRRMFYWLQSGDASKDAEGVAALLKAINEPDAAARPAGRRAGGASAAAGGGLTADALAAMLASLNPSATAPASPAPAPVVSPPAYPGAQAAPPVVAPDAATAAALALDPGARPSEGVAAGSGGAMAVDQEAPAGAGAGAGGGNDDELDEEMRLALQMSLAEAQEQQQQGAGGEGQGQGPSDSGSGTSGGGNAQG